MFGTQDFIIFLVAGITLNLVPGPDTMYIIGRSIAQGRHAGFLSALGISSGSLIHATAAAFGLSAILVSSAVAFSLVKWAGVVYLVYLGVRMLLNRAPQVPISAREAAGADRWAIYRQGLLTNLFNPKVAIFFLAFLPQFVISARADSPWPFLFLGIVFVCTGTIWCLIVAALAAKSSTVLRTTPRTLAVVQRITGVVFVGLGIRLATQDVR